VSLYSTYDRLLDLLADACRRHYGTRLRALAVFGSVGRGTMHRDSDIDLLIVADPLPPSRLARAREFDHIEQALAPALQWAVERGVRTRWSPVFKTSEELRAGSPLLLDMVEDARVLQDPDHLLRGVLDRLRQRLHELGARRVWRGNHWYWDLKPDYRPGETFQL
jgi:uncharacterized protein